MSWIEHAIEWPFKEITKIAGTVIGGVTTAAGKGVASIATPVVSSIIPILIIAAIVLILVLPKMNLSLI